MDCGQISACLTFREGQGFLLANQRVVTCGCLLSCMLLFNRTDPNWQYIIGFRILPPVCILIGSNWDSRACVNPLSPTFLQTDPLLFQSSVFFVLFPIFIVFRRDSTYFSTCVPFTITLIRKHYMLLGGLFFWECAISDPGFFQCQY